MLHVLVLADTHLRRDWPNRTLPTRVREMLGEADVILHAGDVLQPEHLDDLARHAPLHVVRGNNDDELEGVPERLDLELAGVRLGMVHDSGPARGRAARLHGMFPDADVVVFGHSHVPWDVVGVGGQRLFNPGSPTERRQQPHRTAGWLDVADGRVLKLRTVVVDDGA